MRKLADTAESSAALDKPADLVAANVDRVMAQAPNSVEVENALHGTWLGHPLHPILTDVPIGAWTLAGILDVVDMIDGNGRSTATPAIGIGVLASLPTAAAGVMDWRHSSGGTRRVGVAHALLNTGALALYTASLALRPRRTAIARLLGFGGLGLMSASAYLGGHMVFSLGMGVKHEADLQPPSGPTSVSIDGGLTEDIPRKVEVQGFPFAVVRHGGKVYALADVCPHMGCSLSNGSVLGRALVCPCHGSTFALEDGRVLKGPSAYPVRAFHASGDGASLTIEEPASQAAIPAGAPGGDVYGLEGPPD